MNKELNNVVSLDEFTPHCHSTDPVTKNVHVFPISLVRDLANGRIELSKIDEPEETIRSMLFMLIDRIDDEIKESNNE